MIKTVAVMQPYFFPYGGYFSLLRAVDHFVIFDCVQFPRRGWVHRNKVPGPGGAEEWFTLPMAHQPREISIRELDFATDADQRLAEMLKRYPWLMADGGAAPRIREFLSRPLSRPIEFLTASLALCADLLEVRPTISFSSGLNLSPELKAQDRVIAAAKAVGATRYVNASGGREIYQSQPFADQGLELLFLSPYQGSTWSMLYRLCTEPAHEIAQEIADNGLAQP